MKKTDFLFSMISLSMLSLPNISQAVSTQAEQHTITLKQIYPPAGDRAGGGAHSSIMISDKNGKTIIANHYDVFYDDGYVLSHDKGLNWFLVQNAYQFFAPQDFSPTNDSEAYAISVSTNVKDQDLKGILEHTVDAGASWEQVTPSTCPVYVKATFDTFTFPIASKVRVIPNADNQLLFIVPTKTRGDDIYYSEDGGQTCKKTKELAQGFTVHDWENYEVVQAVVVAENNIFAVEKSTGNVYHSSNGKDWNVVFKDPIGNIVTQAQDHNNGALDYLVSSGLYKNGTMAISAISNNSGQTFNTNLKSVNFLATTSTNSQLFAVDDTNTFMLQSSPGVYDQFSPLQVVFSDSTKQKDLSNWKLYSAVWTNPEHTEGILNFTDNSTPYEEASYQFEIQ